MTHFSAISSGPERTGLDGLAGDSSGLARANLKCSWLLLLRADATAPAPLQPDACERAWTSDRLASTSSCTKASHRTRCC